MKKYMVYMEDGDNLYKVAIPADSVKAAKKYVEGNGKVLKCVDITNDYPISVDKVVKALEAAGFGTVETDLIMRTLMFHDIAE